MADYWFNVKTHRVEEGHQSDSSDLMGPYATRADAGPLCRRLRRTPSGGMPEPANESDRRPTFVRPARTRLGPMPFG